MDWRLHLVRSLPRLLLAASIAGCSATETTSADRFTESGHLIAVSGGDAGAANACIACHDLDGLGNGAGTPRLAGLDTGYLERQLEAYANGTRRHPEMGAIARQLDHGDRLLVSSYYAALPYQPNPSTATLQPPPTLYAAGDPERGLPACASCHGTAGQGIGAANPPLGGQPAAYLAEQMEKWRRSERRNDPGNVMLRISQLLTPSEIAVLSAYAAGLPGGLPRPGSPGASLAARRADPRNDASATPARGVGPKS